MTTDGGLRQLFAKHMPDAMWCPIESWSTGQGIPDTEFCFPGGKAGWVEMKSSATGSRLKHPPTPQQIAWLERRARLGGRCFVAVRLQRSNGPRKEAADALYLYDGAGVRALLRGVSASNPHCLGFWLYGPSCWNWAQVRNLLIT